MVVFSDLDRSIIYSSKFLNNDFSQLDKLDIEIYNGKNISYISKNTIEYIKKIKSIYEFIPTTTRTIEQFKRIDFQNYGIDFKYAITSNGGNILINGVKDLEYKKIIDEKLKDCLDISKMIDLFEPLRKIKGIEKFRVAEDLFFYIVIDKEVFDIKELDDFIKDIKEHKWDVYISGRKIYFLPEVVKKSTAIKYLCEKFSYNETFAIGDSTMDEDMLNLCENSYILKHGDLINKLTDKKEFIISDNEGFMGSEEILHSIITSKK